MANAANRKELITMKQGSHIIGLALLAVAIILCTLAFAQDFPDTTAFPGSTGEANVDKALLPRAKIFQFKGDVVQLDTATGEVFKFTGNLDNPNARGTLRVFVRPINGATSGFLDIQRSGGATFLVDIVTGQTWLLRERGNVAVWDPVDVVGS